MSARDCPDCDTRMQAFWVPSKKAGAEVELDRCNDCGGVWFDSGELAAASGRSVTGTGEETDRQCPACDASLHEASLAGSIAVETCPECAGTFLEARDMDALVKKSKPKSAPGGTGFVCDACGQRKPFSLAQATLTGLECDVCVKAKSAPPAPPEKAESCSVFGKFVGWLRGE
jgi:Zn-finger nucleic acid-binding protein